MKKMTEEQKNIAREAAEVESLIYDDICDEVHELGMEAYDEISECGYAKTMEKAIDRKCDEFYKRFHAEHPEYSRTAFGKVFYFIINEGKEMARERGYAC